MAGHYTLTGDFQLISEEQGTLYNVGISDIELSSDATKGQGVILRTGETQAFKGTIYARSYDESGSLNVQNFIELPGGGESGGGGGGGGTPYTLPTMAQNVKGGAKLGAGLTMTGEVLSLSPIYVPSAVVSQTATGAILTVSDHNGTTTASIKSGADGADGETPTISTDSIDGGNSVTFGTSAGYWTINIYDGKDGTDGADGVSPTVSVDSIEGGNKVKFTSAAGLSTVNILNGTNGTNGVSVSMSATSYTTKTALTFTTAGGTETINVFNGKDGAKGADGKSFEIKAQYASYEDLIAGHATGSAGDAYLVGEDTNPDLYIWLTDDDEWVNSGKIAGIVGPKGDKGDPGKSARVSIEPFTGGNRVTFTDGYGTQSCAILNGTNGANGVSPVVSVSTKTGGHVLKITDALGETSFDVMDGKDGLPGADGKSITCSVASITGGNKVTLSDGTASNSFDVMNGADGQSVTVETATINGGNAVTFTDKAGGHTVNIYDGADGVNGVSPIVSFATIPTGHVMTVSDAQGQKSITIKDGSGTGGSVVEYNCVGVISWQHTLRANCLKLDGATVTASDYPQLLQYVQDNNLTVTAAEWESNCVMYVYDSGNDTLKLPDLTNMVVWGVVNNPRSIEAGLPNIEGSLSNSVAEYDAAATSALYRTNVNSVYGAVAQTNGTLKVCSHAFNASRSDSIYGGSTTVQPPAAGLIPQVRYQSEMLSELVPTYRKNSQAYAVGDIAYTTKLPSWARLECVVAGTTNSTEPSFAGAAVGQYVTDGTCKWIVEDIRNGHLVGEVFNDTILRPGCVKALGATASNASTNYPRILAYLTANPSMAAADATDKAANPYKWLYDSVNDTLTMPDYTDQFIEGGAAAGVKSAGLPEISGKFYAIPYTTGALTIYSQPDSGAISVVGGAGTAGSFGSNLSNASITTTAASFTASRSDSIYGGSNTVQPSAIVNIPQFKY